MGVSCLQLMKYQQLSQDERYRIGALKHQRLSLRKIAERLGRAPSTISREVRRNRYPSDGRYRALHANGMTNARRRNSRRNSHYSAEQWLKIERLLQKDWSPEQISGYLRESSQIRISHETIYRWIWMNRLLGGSLWKHLRGSQKKRRKRYAKNDSRGRLAGKRSIEERPKHVENRRQLGHWEVDTVHGSGRHSVVTLVERKSGYVEIGKITAVTIEETNRAMIDLIGRHYHSYKSITSDNGGEFHGYRKIETITDIPFYFCHPHHSWERGTNENTNGLIRQYLPKGKDLTSLTQERCDEIAEILNSRPRKRLQFKTPLEVFLPASVALHS